MTRSWPSGGPERGPISTPESWWIVLLLLALVVAGVEALRRTSLAMEEMPAVTDMDA